MLIKRRYREKGYKAAIGWDKFVTGLHRGKVWGVVGEDEGRSLICVGWDTCLRVREKGDKDNSFGRTCMTLSKVALHDLTTCAQSCNLTMSPSTKMSGMWLNVTPPSTYRQARPYYSCFLLLWFLLGFPCQYDVVESTCHPQWTMSTHGADIGKRRAFKHRFTESEDTPCHYYPTLSALTKMYKTTVIFQKVVLVWFYLAFDALWKNELIYRETCEIPWYWS